MDPALKDELAIRRLDRQIQENPRDPRLYYQQGRLYLELGRWTDAVRVLEKAISLDPYFYQARFDLGVVYTRMRKEALAVREWESMTDPDGDLYLEGIDYSRFSVISGALRDWEQYRQKTEPSIFKDYDLGIAMLVLGNPEAAVESLEEVIKVNPDFKKVRYYKGLALLQLGRHLEAADEFRRITDVRPRDPQALYWTGHALLEAGRSTQALDYFRRALQDRPRYSKALYRMGLACTRLFRYDEAIPWLSQAIESRPRFAEAHYVLGRCLEKQYVMDQAVQAYERAVELDPGYQEAHMQLGMIYKNVGEHQKALEHLRRAVELDPLESEAYYSMGIVLAGLGRYEEAIPEYRRALELSPRHAYAYYSLGQAYVHCGRFGEAAESFKRALELNPRDVPARTALGMVYFHRGELGRAVEEFQKVLEVNPRDVEAHYFLGASLFKMGKLEQAIEEYQQAARVNPDSALNYFSLGASYSRSGNYQKALEQFQKAAEFRPDSDSDLGMFAVLNLLASIGIEHAREGARLQRYASNLEELYLQFVQALANFLDARDRYTRYHSRRVAIIGSRLAEQLGLPPAEVTAVRIGGHLHDIGKIGVPDYILRKEGKLTSAEIAMIKLHPEIGEEALKQVPFPWDILPIIRHHHEKWDGSGYPDGLKEDEIPFHAQIIGVADFYDALTTHRPYREPFTPQQALDTMKRMAGTYFNPRLVMAFEKIVDDLILVLPSAPPAGEGGPVVIPEGVAMDGLSVSWDFRPGFLNSPPGGEGRRPSGRL